jgi:hypothetical protein
VIGVDGLGLIAYSAYLSNNLKVAHCNDVLCSSAGINTVSTGSQPSLAIGADGLGLISHLDQNSSPHHLAVTHCSDIACTTGATFAVDTSSNDVGYGSSITISPDGYGIVSYQDLLNSQLKVARCMSLLCSNSSINRVDSNGGALSASSVSSITIGVDGFGIIAYVNTSSQSFNVDHLSNNWGVPWYRAR